MKAYITLGWTPLLGLEADGERVVLKVIGWSGGTGTAPAVNQYVGTSGFVGSAAAAVNIRGTIIESGPDFPIAPADGHIFIKTEI